MRKLFIFVVCCSAVLLTGYAGYRSYKVWKAHHLMSLGRDFLAKSDRKNAVLSVQEVLASDPRNLEATRAMAQFAEASRAPGAVLWRSRVVELAPHSLPDRLALVQTALTMHDYATATNALEAVDSADKQTAAYRNIAGMVAATTGHPGEAEKQFLEVIRIDPNDVSAQLNLAVVRLHRTNKVELEAARDTLHKLAGNPTNSNLRCMAMRELTLDAMGYGDAAGSLSLSKQLTLETNSEFSDQILRLEVLRELRQPEFRQYLTNCQREATTNQAKTYELARWEMTKVSVQEALSWLQTLPKNAQTNQPATLLIAECYTASKDWKSLHGWLEKQRWAEMEFLRHALMSRALRGEDLAASSKTEWEQALKLANAQKQSLVMMLGMAAQWGWLSEGEELLWTMFNRFPDEKWAKRALTKTLFEEGETRSLMQLFEQELKRTPSDLSAKNNLATVALLLNAKELKPFDLAQEVYNQHPDNPSFAATYGFALYLQGKTNEALKIMQKVKAQDLDIPAIAGYYGVILKGAGDRPNAKIFLAKASRSRFLPEERKLFTQAWSEL
jgi:tetratricopeptide (TPR) repeat protein